MPQVSVIIPNYNHAPYLVQRIDSVLNQTFQDFEVIILDDCSPDNSREIIEQYRTHPKVVHIEYNTKNSGSTFRQWKKGIDLAQGEYIWIAESDDWAEEGFLEVMVYTLNKHPSVGVTYCQSWRVDHDNKILNSCKDWYTERWHNDFINNGTNELNNYFLNSGIVNASAALFRRDIALKISTDYTSLKFSGDWYFWINIILLSDIYFIAKELNNFRYHDNNVSNNATKVGLGILEGLTILSKIRRKINNKASYTKKLNYLIGTWLNTLKTKHKMFTLSMNIKIAYYTMILKCT